MEKFSLLIFDLLAAIAARAARDRALTVLLVALHARIARMGTRLARLIDLWRAGKLPRSRAPGDAGAARAARKPKVANPYPRAAGWLLRKLGYEVAAYGSQLRHLLTEAECVAFVAAVPQAGRILRPLLGLLTFDPLPAVLRAAPAAAINPAPSRLVQGAKPVVTPGFNFFSA